VCQCVELIFLINQTSTYFYTIVVNVKDKLFFRDLITSVDWFNPSFHSKVIWFVLVEKSGVDGYDMCVEFCAGIS